MKIIQIVATPETPQSPFVLFALTDTGEIFEQCSGKWTKTELPFSPSDSL